MTEPNATVTVSVRAEPEAVYRLITDLDTLAGLAEETTRMRWTKGADRAAPGASFKGTNRNGFRRWTTTCTVTVAEPGLRFAFEVRHTVLPIARWEYAIVPTDDGCTVTESTWDRRPGWFKGIAGLATGEPDRARANARHIEATLERLKARAEGKPAPAA